MSLTVFPPETVEHILSSGLEQQDVLASMKTTRQFLEIARPLIYRSIVIRSHHQFDKFKEQVAPEDVGKVRTVSIVGKGNPWEKDKLQGVADWFRQMEESERDTNQAGTVERLFKGELLNANRIDQIFIHHVLENPVAIWENRFWTSSQFSNLVDLSIVSQRGGANVLQDLLQRRYLPKLERLVLCDVTWAARAIPSRPPTDLDDLGAELANSDLFQDSFLKLLVSPTWQFLRRRATMPHLAIITSKEQLLTTSKYAVIYISTRPDAATEIDTVFLLLARVAAFYHVSSLKYLALPSDLQSKLSSAQKKVLDSLVDHGAAVHHDGDLGRSMAPPSFLKFRRKQIEEGLDTNEGVSQLERWPERKVIAVESIDWDR